jgi:hypothetical protein
MSAEILIRLNKTDFVAGEVVEGELELQVDTAIPVRGIRLLLHGFEQSYWRKGGGNIRSSVSGRHKRTHSEARDLFKEEITLYGDPPLDAAALISDSVTGLFSSEHYHVLEPGSYKYPFSYRLPEHLPGDYDDRADRSKIEYLVKGCVDLPLKFDVEETVYLTMHEAVDEAALPSEPAANSRTFDYEAGTDISMTANLDKAVYYPGETAECRLKVENHSKRKVESVSISLQKTETLKAHDASTINTETIHTLEYAESRIAAGDTAELHLQFPIPHDLYPSITSSELVRVEYALVATANIPWGTDLDLELPIVLLESIGQPGGITKAKRLS